MMSLFSKGSTDENSFTWNLKKGIFRDFFVQNFVLFLFCISGAGAPCGLLQIPAFRFHRFAWPFETAGPSVDIAGKRRVGKDKSNTPPRPHQKWDEPRSAGAKRFSLLDFRISPSGLRAPWRKRFKTFRPCVWGRELLPVPGSCAHEILSRRPWKSHAHRIVRDWTRSPARTLKPTGGGRIVWCEK